MKNLLNAYITFFIKEKKQRRRVLTVLAMMAVFAGLTALWQLRVTGLAQTNDALCGVKEHVHTEDCITRELVCGQEETDGHIHTDDCYSVETVLACEERHEHTENCYMHVRSLTCGQEECEAHHHMDDCYLAYYHCGYEAEHTHTEACYVDEGAQDDWEAELPEQTGIWAQDLLAVAQSQLGTEESQVNYIKLEDGTRMGYTRYGAKFGAPYMQWDAAFVSFCLHYAGISEEIVPYGTEDMQSWADALNEQGMLFDTSAHSVQPGDAVLLRTSDEEQTAQTAGIVEKNENDTLTVIGRSANNVVEEQAYTADSVVGVVPVGEIQTELAATQNIALMMTTANDAPMARAGEGSLAKYIVDKVSINGETYTTGFSLDFDIETGSYNTQGSIALKDVPNTDVDGNPAVYTYILPEAIIDVNLLGQEQVLMENATKIGSYTITQRDDGRYVVTVKTDRKYAEDNPGGTFNAELHFSSKLDKKQQNTDKTWTVDFSDTVHVTVDPKPLFKDHTTTDGADIKVEKNGKWDADTNEMVYSVTVSSIQGTKEPIKFTDTATIFQWSEAAFAGAASSITVTKGVQTVTPSPLTATKTGDKTISINGTLDALGKGESYTIQYRIPVSAQPGKQFGISNAARAETTEVYDEGKSDGWYTIEAFSKSGSYNSSTNQIDWEIKLNAEHANIVGEKLTDTMFDQIIDGTLKIEPNTGYTVEKDGSKITDIKFDAVSDGENTNKYVIKYSTPAKENMQPGDKDTVTNTAKFKENKTDAKVEYEKPKPVEPPTPPETQPPETATKKFIEAGNKNEDGTIELTWQATYATEKIVKNTTIVDVLRVRFDQNNDQVNWDGNLHYFTKTQAASIEQGIQSFFASVGANSNDYVVEFGDTKDPDSNGGWKSLSSYSDGAKLTHFRIRVLNTIDLQEKQLTLTYRSTIKPDASYEFYNDFEGQKDKYNYIDSNSKVLKTDGADKTGTQYEITENGELVWKVKVTLDQDCKKLEINDTLPEGVGLTALTFKGLNVSYNPEITPTINIDGTLTEGNQYYSDARDKYNVTVDGTHDDRNVNLILTRSDNQWPGAGNLLNKSTEIEVTYKCQITDWNTADYHTKYELKNSVEVKMNGEPYGSSSMTQKTEKTKDVLTKEHDPLSGESHARKLDYSVLINQLGDDLVEGSNTLDLEDIISSSNKQEALNNGQHVQLDTSSLTLYRLFLDEKKELVLNEDGNGYKREKITNWTWEYTEGWDTSGGWQNKLTAKIPDGIPLLLEYSYKVAYDEKGTASNKRLNLSNQVTLTGQHQTTDQTEGNEVFPDNEIGGSAVGAKQFKLIKVREDDNSILLDGAEFTVFKAADGQPLQNKVYTTGNDKGELTIRKSDGGFEENVLYYIQETKAPTNYEKPDPAPKYYFYWSSGNNQTIAGWENLEANADVTDLSTRSHIVTAQNKLTDNYTLPATGGAGVLPIRLLGGGLLSAALALALLRRKHS